MDSDDVRLAAVFRAAVADAVPPASFDHADVVAASRRVTARRRSALAGGALAVLAVTGVGVAGTLLEGGDNEQVTSAAPASAPEVADDARAAAPGPASADVPETMLSVPPPAPGAAGSCANLQDPALGDPALGDPALQDLALRALLEEVLPEVAGAAEAATTTECRPGGERGVHLRLPDGLFSVAYLPPGAQARPPEPGVRRISEPTASGGTVIVISQAGQPGSVGPFADRVDEVATYLAPRL
ncbi:MAG: hypothetical protein ACRDRK_15655 [Pseudonocardia sp.]